VIPRVIATTAGRNTVLASAISTLAKVTSVTFGRSATATATDRKHKRGKYDDAALPVCRIDESAHRRLRHQRRQPTDHRDKADRGLVPAGFD
jgi:hypothetical protein